ncbi:hypothetical protein RSSM_04002 [Rhodopirellula sallentina SM41]|uniref:Uncharacterized protein n=1 Tax=Rhodopirellula sallentina SM41 TaxID=1263870 RepID=M5U9K0_9BACT|nr:hypothetical protein RSSM_04002 [Rhodopirellula sallentina SM41]
MVSLLQTAVLLMKSVMSRTKTEESVGLAGTDLAKKQFDLTSTPTADGLHLVHFDAPSVERKDR